MFLKWCAKLRLKLLLDSHTLLWYVLGDSQLSSNATTSILDPSNEVFVSIASLWEIAIKVSINKLSLHRPYHEFLDKCFVDYGFTLLPIEPNHLVYASSLPYPGNHRDPFDRLLVVQSKEEGMAVVSSDVALDSYGVSRIW